MNIIGIYAAAALAEIAGCFAFWGWLRMGKPAWWAALGVLALIAFAWLLTLVPAGNASRAFAAYGGIYIVAAILWLWGAEGYRPDRWDVTGGAICLVGMTVILFGPRP